MSSALQRILFRLSSGLTDRMPLAGARFLDATVVPVMASRHLERFFAFREDRILSRMGSVRRILVLADIHLGDAVVHQSMVTALRDFFPLAEIEYAISRSAVCLVAGNPEITGLLPIYSGGSLPSRADRRHVAELCRNGGFDLVINACPFFVTGNPLPSEAPVLSFTNHAPQLLRNEQELAEPNHFLYQAHVYLHRVLGRRYRPVRRRPPLGVGLRLTDEAYGEASDFLDRLEWSIDGPLVLINPDTASPFTRPPVELLTRLLTALATRPLRILVGEGHTDRGIGSRLIHSLPRRAAARARVVPARMPADAYAALTDLVDVFVSGDTGPLHWAAARKFSRTGHYRGRNQTAVVSLFGATPARMSGYDSVQPGFLPAWQDASSTTLVSGPPCRNITCLNKLEKTCRIARCFECLPAEPIVETISRLCEEAIPVRTVASPVLAAWPEAGA